jgi:hypothetical protein
MKKCVRCGGVAEDTASRCTRCGGEVLEVPGAGGTVRRPAFFYSNEAKMRYAIQKQRLRTCVCGQAMSAIGGTGYFLHGGLVGGQLVYECTACHTQVLLPTMSYIVFVTVLVAVFGWALFAIAPLVWEPDPSDRWFKLGLCLALLAGLFFSLRALWRAIKVRRARPLFAPPGSTA